MIGSGLSCISEPIKAIMSAFISFSGKTLFMVLTKEDAVENWRGALGPTDPQKAKEEAPDR